MALTDYSNASLERIAEVIRDHESFVLCGHVSPDGDCLGSQLALMGALRQLGKDARCILVADEPIDRALSFMPGADEFIAACAYKGPTEVFVGLDVPTRERIGEDACAILDACATSITIDHHDAGRAMCEHVHTDPKAASTSMLVWELACLLCDEVPASVAQCAYTGLVTDTGGFRFQNSDERAFSAAAAMVRCGAEPARVAAEVYQSRSLASVQLEALMLSRMHLGCGGAYALGWIGLDDMARLGAEKGDTETLVDALRSIAGVRVACLLKEQDGSVRGSLRAKDATDVAALARTYGGGGHTAAAGFTYQGSLVEAVEEIERALEALAGEGGMGR